MNRRHTGLQSWTDDQINTLVSAYVRTALWSTTDDDDTPLEDAHDPGDIAADAQAAMRADVLDFYAANRRDLCGWVSPDDAGHLFWLNRNGHGVGFWDRTYPGADTGPEYRKRYGLTRAEARSRVRFNDAMTRLSDAAKVYGDCDLYVGDDGKIHAQ